MGRFIRNLFYLLVLTGLVSCSNSKSGKSAATFDLSQLQQKLNSSSTSSDVNFVAINVTGSGMDRVKCTLDKHDDQVVWKGNCRSSGSMQVTIEDIPAGSARLIQVLAITEVTDASGEESEVFNYGESTQDLASGPDNQVRIQLQSKPTSTNKESSASGRYLFADGSAYTGKLALEFAPPTGSPPMEIFQLEMFDGWFTIYLLDNIDLTYRMLGVNKVMFGRSVKQSSPILQGTSTAVKTLELPKTFEDRGAGVVDEEEPRFMSIGFYRGGAPDTTKTVCHDTSSVTFPDMYLDAGLTDSLDWPADFSLTPSGSTCALTDPPLTTNRMILAGPVLGSGGGGSPLFYGPYQKFVASEGELRLMEYNVDGSSRLTVNWKYLPGVIGSNKVTGSTVFYSLNPPNGMSENHDGGEGFDCSILPSMGFASVDISGSTESATIAGVPQTFMNSGKLFVCPRDRNGSYYTRVLENYSCGGCGGGGSPATNLVIHNPYNYGTPLPYLNQNACTLIQIRAEDGTGQIGELPNYPYQVDFSASQGTFYNDPGCGTSTTSESMYGSVMHIWFKGNFTSGNSNITVSANAGETTALSSASVNPNFQAPATPDHFHIFGKGELYAEELGGLNNQCETYLMTIVDTNEVPTHYNGSPPSGTASMSLSSFSGQFFAPGDCGGTPDNTFSIAGFTSIYVKEFRPSSLGSGTMTVDGSGLAPSLGDGNFPVNVSDPTAEYARIEHHSGSFAQNACVELKVVTYSQTANSGSVRSKIAGAETYTLSTSGVTGSFYSDPGCTTSTTTISQSASTSETASFYFKPTDISATDLEFFGSAGNDANMDANSDKFSY